MRSTSRAIVFTGLLVLMTGPDALAVRGSETPLLHALEVGPEGGQPARLECAATTLGDRPGVVLRNSGQHAATLFFLDGSKLLLAPGHEVTLSEAAASSHKCACQCTCAVGGVGQKLTFDCPTGGCVGENHSPCLVFQKNDLKEGILSDCRKIYIPR